MDTAEASAVIVKGRFCGAPNTASGGYVAGLLGRHLTGPARELAYLDAQGGRPQGFAGRRADRNARLYLP